MNDSDVQFEVTAPSRLHFGLLSFGGPGRQFGGAGVMIDRPRTLVRFRRAGHFQVTGLRTPRTAEVAQTWARYHRIDAIGCHIDVREVAPAHCGLGSGTQLALSIAAGLNAIHGRSNETAVELARSVNRGLRSAVGTYGFVEGGLIVERGKTDVDAISPLDCRAMVPSQWRFVLVRPAVEEGLSGQAEQTAFDSMPSVPVQVSHALIDELRLHMLPAVMQADFEAFAASLYRYGSLAGSCFEEQQGGVYNGPRVTALVEAMRAAGAVGVGQSSWGPTLFAVMQHESAARGFVQRLRRAVDDDALHVDISAPCVCGGRLKRLPPADDTMSPTI